MAKIEEMSPKQYEKWYWSDYTEKCKSCMNKCKQSHIVELLRCEQYKAKEENAR